MVRFVLGAVFTVLAFVGTASAQNPGVYTPGSPDLSGRWSGYWVSAKNGHSGPLQGRFRQLDADTYRVVYTGRFWGVFPFRYSTKMEVVGIGEGVAQLTASRRLGPLGTFSTLATATDSHFDATFSSRSDSGRFVMSRRR
jgi:hypothetical protein